MLRKQERERKGGGREGEREKDTDAEKGAKGKRLQHP